MPYCSLLNLQSNIDASSRDNIAYFMHPAFLFSSSDRPSCRSWSDILSHEGGGFLPSVQNSSHTARRLGGHCNTGISNFAMQLQLDTCSDYLIAGIMITHKTYMNKRSIIESYSTEPKELRHGRWAKFNIKYLLFFKVL